MRFSDLNKAKHEPGRPEPKEPARPAPAPEFLSAAGPGETFDQGPRKPGRAKTRPEAKSSPKEPAEPFGVLDARAKEVYARVLDQAGDLLKRTEQPYTEKYEAVMTVCDLAAETLKTNCVLLTYTSYGTAEDYLHAHTANTAIISMAMGLAADLPPAELRLLGFCAMAHDIGMTGYSDLYNKEDRLNDEEFSELTLHAEAGADKLDRIVDLDYKIKERTKKIVLQVHERMDGSGYPDRLSDEEIDPLAQFLAVADAYEAMTHARPWREAINPPDAIKELIEMDGRGFASKAVKALLASLSVYPPDSIVLLSTGEIGRVIKVNKGSLTRPLVETVLSRDFAPIPPQTVDLLEYPLTSIERPVGIAEIREHNPKFAAHLEMARWWVEWE